MKRAIFFLVLSMAACGLGWAQIPPAQKASIEAFQKARAEGAAKRQAAMEACREIATKHPVKPATAKEEQAAAYDGCMAGKGYKQ